MKKILAVVLSIVMLLMITACGADSSPIAQITPSPSVAAPTQTPEPTPEPTPTPEPKYVYDRVIILGVDGAGAFFRAANTPNIDRIFSGGAITYTMQAATPSISAQCWGSMLHGVTPVYHRLDNNVVGNTAFSMNSDYPSIFKLVREAYPDAKLASFCNWNPINVGIIENGINVTKNTGDNDEEITNHIFQYLNTNDPKLMFVQFDEVDGAGHSYGYGSQEHLDQIGVIDGYIGQIFDKLEDKNLLDGTLFIVTADHGGYEKSHGDDTDVEMNVMFAVRGETVKAKGNPGKMEMRDIASIVLYALDVEQTEFMTSVVPSNVFENVYAKTRPEPTVNYEYEYRDAKPKDAPDADSENYLTKVFNEEKIKYYFAFDANKRDVLGANSYELGRVSLTDGYYGKAAKVASGALRVMDFAPGEDSFSLSFWVKTEGTLETVTLVGNSERFTDKAGFVINMNMQFMEVTLGNGSQSFTASFTLPKDYHSGWMHVTMVVDREASKIGFSYDFGTLMTRNIPESFAGISFDGESGEMYIGTDSAMGDTYLNGIIDEMIVYNGALTQADVNTLATYYGITK